MKNNFFKLAAVLSAAFFFACNSGQEAVDTEIEVSEVEIEENLRFLASDELQGRATGTEGIEKAATFIEEYFKEYDVAPYFENYRDRFEVEGKEAFNVVGFLEGNDQELKDEFIIIGAHYDHIGFGEAVENDSIANGANDNAAGTVAVMELARRFAEKENNARSLLFILFSGEELGLTGAKHIAQKLKAKNLDLYAVVNLEMIGVPMEEKDHLAYLTGYENSNYAEKFNEYVGEKVLGFLPQAKEYNLFQRSDNYPFFEEFNIPSQTISTFDFTNYDYYHHVSDEADNMDFQHMANLIEAIFPAISKMANTEEKEIKLN
ncbi:M20/M25/M40 family metallo-hydrolase [Salegentibacter sp. F188]|uniref:M20/M25/M40 family metallo-hydrolase n=1 Tax=Autumnicola patrickiae TaxID=3075591 RepID=A0ABU3DZU0_9FLAO|nr:M20/M25/M40 family metallo-hydrolase [Salegentibacter sp. F188]MDT0689226.1 M20/M25/M40 family metallo-hydrolase [Salegentibacter sp. F188]